MVDLWQNWLAERGVDAPMLMIWGVMFGFYGFLLFLFYRLNVSVFRKLDKIDEKLHEGVENDRLVWVIASVLFREVVKCLGLFIAFALIWGVLIFYWFS